MKAVGVKFDIGAILSPRLVMAIEDPIESDDGLDFIRGPEFIGRVTWKVIGN